MSNYRCSYCFENYCTNSPTEEEILEWQVEMVRRKDLNLPAQEPILICQECLDTGAHKIKYREELIKIIDIGGREVRMCRRIIVDE